MLPPQQSWRALVEGAELPAASGKTIKGDITVWSDEIDSKEFHHAGTFR
jgi:hypothetical protein